MLVMNGKRIPCYNLGIGILASEKDAVERLCKTVQEVMAMQPAKRKELWKARRQKMLTEKIDYAKFLTWFIENYPSSAEQTQKADVAFWEKFK